MQHSMFSLCRSVGTEFKIDPKLLSVSLVLS
jgi:hypothetical protein